MRPGAVVYNVTDTYAYTVTSQSEKSTAGMSAVKRLWNSFGEATRAVGAFASSARGAMSAGAELLALIGMGRPSYTGVPTVIAQAPNADLGTGVGMLAGIYLADVDSRSSAVPDHTIMGLCDEDEMSVAFLGRCPSLVLGSDGTATWPYAAAYGTTLCNIPVCPATLDNGLGGTGLSTF